MRRRIVTFSNLFPSPSLPTHGLFVRERMRRVVAALGCEWVVVNPLPAVPIGLRRGFERQAARAPEREVVDGVAIWHPRYRHLPGISMWAQARRMARSARALVERLLAEADAVLDAHYVYPDGVAALAIAAPLGVPTVVTARGTDVNVVGALRGVAAQVRASMPAAFARLAVSEPLRQRFVEVAGLADADVQLSRNGVDFERFAPGDRAAARTALGLPQEGHLVLGVGRLIRAKGFHRAVEALDALPATKLVLIGDGNQRRALCRSLGDRGLWLGPQPPERVALAYSACDVLVLPSEREGWPNVVTEALASGLPVVASAVGSVPEMLAGPGVGTAIPVGDVAALRDAVRGFLDRPPDRAAIRAWAQRYSWDAPVAGLVALFERAWQSKSGGVVA